MEQGRNSSRDERVLCSQFPRPVFVGADLASAPLAEALTSRGFDPFKPSLFTCEGILCYLPQVQPLSHHTEYQLSIMLPTDRAGQSQAFRWIVPGKWLQWKPTSSQGFHVTA